MNVDLGSCKITFKSIEQNAQDFVWFDITCSGAGSKVCVEAMTDRADLKAWLASVERVHQSLNGEAKFTAIEPKCTVTINCNRLGQLTVDCDLSQEPTDESHYFRFHLDQTYLISLINALRGLLNTVRA